MNVQREAILEGKNCHGRGVVYRQIFCSGVASLLQLMQGCVLPLSSIILPQIQAPNEDFTITKDQGSWFASIFCIGLLSGAIGGGLQSDYFGRKISLMIDGVLAIMGILIIAFTRSYPLLLLARYICGHASGSGTVSIPIYCSEISHPDIRSITASFIALFYYFGYCITTLLGTSMPWRIATASIAILPVTSICILFFCPESPVWLLRQKREDDALKSLIYFRGSESAAEEEKQIIKRGLYRLKKEHETLGSTSDQLRQMVNQIKSPSFWKPFLIVFFLFVIFNEWCGMPMVAFYMVDILGDLGLPLDPFTFASFLSISRFITCGIFLGFLYKFKRRPLYITSILFMISGNVIVASYHFALKRGFLESLLQAGYSSINWIPAFGLSLLYLSATFGFAQVTYGMQGELFSADTRAIGGGIIGICDGISLFLSTKIGPSILENIGIFGFFSLNTIVLVMAAIFAFFFYPETHGLHLEEIEQLFLGKNTEESEEKGSKCPV